MLDGMKRARTRLCAIGVAGVAALALAASANAATITVGTLADDGTGCTFREAVDNAKNNNNGLSNGCAAGAGDDTIVFSVTGTIDLPSQVVLGAGGGADRGTITVNGPDTGPGISLSAINNGTPDRVLRVPGYNDPNARDVNAVTLSDITVENGLLNQNGVAGGGIDNSGNLTLQRVTVSGNTVTTSGAGARGVLGGGLNNSGVLSIVDSTFSNNHANSTSTDSYSQAIGGAIYSTGTATITGSTFAFNGVKSDGPAPVAGYDQASGGAIATNGTDNVLTLTNSTVVVNGAENTNTVAGASGGGLYLGANVAGTATLASDTITDNYLHRNGNSVNDGRPAGVYGVNTTPDIQNTIIGVSSGGANCGGFGGVNSLGHNYADDATCDPDVPNGDVSDGDVFNALLPLANNGGPTQTRMPMPYDDAGPTVIDKGITPTGANTDQRGKPRPWFWNVPDGVNGDGTDIGAVEVVGVMDLNTTPAADHPNPVITGTADVGTVQVYLSGGCTGTTLGGPLTPAAFASSGVTAGPLGPNSATPITALASYGEANATCTGLPNPGSTYKVKPTAPALTGTSPSSGGNDNTPAIQGTTLTGTTIDLYANANCSGSPALRGATQAQLTAGVAQSVADNSTTSFSATATGVGGTSDCSAPVSYAEVTPPPPVTTPTPPATAKKKCKKPKKKTKQAVKKYKQCRKK
jgi:hypothetical protein